MLFQLQSHLENLSQKKFFDEKTYGDLALAAGFFQERFQKEKDTFIGLKMSSAFLSFAAQLGALAAGKTGVLLSSLETEETLKNLKQQVPFQTVFTDRDFELSSGEKKSLPAVEIHEDAHAVIVFSSGSSGSPKGIVLTFGNLFYSAKGFAEFFHQSEKDISLMNLPHHHVGGLMTLWRAFLSGGWLISDTGKSYDIISVVPLQLARALRKEDELRSLKKCRVILVGGARLTPELRQASKEKGLSLYETYGMSESASLVCAEGSVLPYREVGLDPRGHFLIKGKTLSPGFYRDGLFHSLQLDQEGFFRTNDLGKKENDRFEFIRRDDLIFISGGENINPLSVEESLRLHPQMIDAYVLPVEDPERWGEAGVCLYESRGDLSPEELKNFLKDKVHPYHVPRAFFPATLQFPGQLKPKRHQLKTLAEKFYLQSLFSFDYHEKKGAPVLVFFHGFTGKKEDFLELGKAFGDKYSLLFIDLPGHGKTRAEAFVSTSDVLSKLARFVKLFTAEPFFYGYSMGGRVALQLSLHYLPPKALILESAGCGLLSEAEAIERKSKDLAMFQGFSSTRDFLQHWYSNDLFKNYRSSAFYRSDLESKSEHELNEWKASQTTLSQGFFPLQKDNLKALKKVSWPVYYLYGSEDIKYKAYAPLFQNSYEIPGASHNPHKTHLPEITAILKTILK